MNVDDFSCDISFQRCNFRENKFPFAITTAMKYMPFLFQIKGKIKVEKVIVWGIC